MKERPILFSGPMVRAILEDRKTMTRRCVPERLLDKYYAYDEFCNAVTPQDVAFAREYEREFFLAHCPYGLPGDRLWVRETFCSFVKNGENGVAYRADTEDGYFSPCETLKGGYPESCLSHPGCDGCTAERWKPTWRPSIFMPRSASRITLEITAVRVERLQGISIRDAISEGVNCACEPSQPCKKCGCCANDACRDDPIRFQCNPRSAFAELWDSINGKRPGCSWTDNPWVWVVEFARIQQ